MAYLAISTDTHKNHDGGKMAYIPAMEVIGGWNVRRNDKLERAHGPNSGDD